MNKALVLFQYQIAGEHLKSFKVTYEEDQTHFFNSLPHMYCVTVISRDGERVTPYGGFLIKTNIPKTDKKILETMYDVAQQLEKVEPILKFGTTIQIVPTNYDQDSIPNESACEQLVVGALYAYGWGGNA